MANRYFLNVGANFGDIANWSTTSGGVGGASVPTSVDFVFWDANSGNCIFNVNVNILGYNTTGYANTITQGAFTFTIGTSNALWASGTFLGSASNITHSRSFVMTGGTFNSTSGVLQVTVAGSSVFAVDITGGIFNHNNGTVLIFGINHSTHRNLAAYPLFNLQINTSVNSDISGLLFVDGLFTSTASGFGLNLVVTLKGSVVGVAGRMPSITFEGTGNQTFTGTIPMASFKLDKPSGSLTFNNNVTWNGAWNHMQGSIIWNNFKAICITSFNGTNKWTNANFYDLEVQAGSGVNSDALGINPIVTNNLIMNRTAGGWIGSTSVGGNVSFLTTFGEILSALILNGTGNQTILSQGTFLASFTINKASGTATLLNNHTILGSTNDVNLVAGTFNQNNFNLVIPDTLNQTGGIYNQGTGVLDLFRFVVSGSGVFNEGGQGIISRGIDFTVAITAIFNRSVIGGGLFANTAVATALLLTMNGYPLSNFSFNRLTANLTLGTSLIVKGFFKKSSTASTANVIGAGFFINIGGDYEQNNIFSSRTLSTSPTWVLDGLSDQNIIAPIDNKLDSGQWKVDKVSGKVTQLSHIIIDNGIVGDNTSNDIFCKSGSWCTNQFNLTVDGDIIILTAFELQKTPASIIVGVVIGVLTLVDSCATQKKTGFFLAG